MSESRVSRFLVNALRPCQLRKVLLGCHSTMRPRPAFILVRALVRQLERALPIVIGGAAFISSAFGAFGCGGSAKDPRVDHAILNGDGGVDESEDRSFVECTTGFRVDFPTNAKGALQHETIDDDGAHAEMVMRTGDGVGYSVTWTPMPPKDLAKAQAAAASAGRAGGSAGPGASTVSGTSVASIALREIENNRLGTTGKLDDERELLLPGGDALEFSFHRSDATGWSRRRWSNPLIFTGNDALSSRSSRRRRRGHATRCFAVRVLVPTHDLQEITATRPSG